VGGSSLNRSRPEGALGYPARGSMSQSSATLTQANTLTTHGNFGEQSSPSESRLPVLDGVRGVAILLVMVHHFGYGASASTFIGRLLLVLCKHGELGVDLFFVLSGFLITRILFRTRLEPNYFRNFYARRSLRIFPLYYAYLILYFGIVTRFTHFDEARNREAASYQAWIWLYATNILICLRGGYLVASVNHFWSLAVEEHFYLIWPALVKYFDIRRILVVCLVAFAIANACRGVIAWQNWSPYAATVFTLCRVDSLAAGALLAVFEQTQPKERIVRAARITFWTLLALVVLYIALPHHTAWSTPVGVMEGSSTAVIFACTIALAVWGPRHSPLSRLFEVRFLRTLGTYAYGLYVLHHPIRIALQRLIPFERVGVLVHSYPLGLFLHSLLAGAASLVAALLSYHLFEKHLLKLKRFFEPRSA
jgi:peptidoglycan/LPS O-acetylase OafA/YrhL